MATITINSSIREGLRFNVKDYETIFTIEIFNEQSKISWNDGEHFTYYPKQDVIDYFENKIWIELKS